jgi:hypothetical protein
MLRASRGPHGTAIRMKGKPISRFVEGLTVLDPLD